MIQTITKSELGKLNPITKQHNSSKQSFQCDIIEKY